MILVIVTNLEPPNDCFSSYATIIIVNNLEQKFADFLLTISVALLNF